jgi:hypothetical protein
MEPLQPVIDGVENMTAAIFGFAAGIIAAAFALIALYEFGRWLMGLFKVIGSDGRSEAGTAASSNQGPYPGMVIAPDGSWESEKKAERRYLYQHHPDEYHRRYPKLNDADVPY